MYDWNKMLDIYEFFMSSLFIQLNATYPSQGNSTQEILLVSLFLLVGAAFP